MTKKEMASAILENVKWNDASKRARMMKLEKVSKARVEELYNAYMNNKENALFYATLL